MPEARASEENAPSGELSNVMVRSMPRAATAASKFPAAATKLGAVARDPAPSSAPARVIGAACAGAAARTRATAAAAAAAEIVPLLARISVIFNSESTFVSIQVGCMNHYEQFLRPVYCLAIIQMLNNFSESQPAKLVKNSDHANHCEPCLFNHYHADRNITRRSLQTILTALVHAERELNVSVKSRRGVQIELGRQHGWAAVIQLR